MLYINPLRDLIHFVKDIYWCNIPLNCRHCLFLRQCRKGWKDHRKCNNGCIKINMLERENYLDGLVKYAEEQDHAKGAK